MRARSSASSVVEPGRREHPVARALDPVGLAVERGSASDSTRTGASIVAATSPRSRSSSARRRGAAAAAGRGRRPPPTVVSPRRTTRSPRAATTRRGEPELRVALADADDARRDVRRAEVHLQPSAVRDRLELVERRRRAGRTTGYAPGSTSASPRAHLAPLDAREGSTATRWPASARSTSRSCTWTLRTRTSRPAGSSRSRSPAPIVPDQSVPGDDRAEAAAARTSGRRTAASADLRARARPRPRRAPSAARSSSSPSPVCALTAHDLGAGHELARLLLGELDASPRRRRRPSSARRRRARSRAGAGSRGARASAGARPRRRRSRAGRGRSRRAGDHRRGRSARGRARRRRESRRPSGSSSGA